MKKFGIIGTNKHTLSPVIYNYWFKKYNIIASYDITNIEQLKQYDGVNITIPYKEEILKYIDKLDKTATDIGAVNIIKNYNNEIYGYNTDAEGFIKCLEHNLVNCNNKNILILGNGGASKAISYALQNNNITIIKRNDKIILDNVDLLINTVPVDLNINLDKLSKQAVVIDIVYSPLMTHLLINAQKNDNKIINGLGMLLQQAALNFEIWFGYKPEITKELEQILIKK